MGQLRVMGREGDTRLIWTKSNADEVKAAKKMFDDLRAKGHLAYKVTKKGKPGEVITEFDPDAEKIILAPPLSGGGAA